MPFKEATHYLFSVSDSVFKQHFEVTNQPPMVPSRLAAIKNLNSVNAAASPDVDLQKC